MPDVLDPLTKAQVEAAEWCEAVRRQAQFVAILRRDLDGAMTALENVAMRAERALSDARAIKAIRGVQDAE